METRYSIAEDDYGLLPVFLKSIGGDIDSVVERVEVALDLFPDKLKFNIVLLRDKKDLSKIYFNRYGKNIDYKAFISLGSMTIFISVKDVGLKVFGHEVAHAVVETYFTERPSYKLHELMAQYAEKLLRG